MLSSWQNNDIHKGNIPNIKAKKTDPVQQLITHCYHNAFKLANLKLFTENENTKIAGLYER